MSIAELYIYGWLFVNCGIQNWLILDLGYHGFIVFEFSRLVLALVSKNYHFTISFYNTLSISNFIFIFTLFLYHSEHLNWWIWCWNNKLQKCRIAPPFHICSTRGWHGKRYEDLNLSPVECWGKQCSTKFSQLSIFFFFLNSPKQSSLSDHIQSSQKVGELVPHINTSSL